MKNFTLKSALIALVLTPFAIPQQAAGFEFPAEERTFSVVGTAEYTDAFFKSFFEQQYGESFKEAFGMDAYTTEVTLEECDQQKGYYRLVNPYKKLCTEIIPANEVWGAVFYYMPDTDFLRIDATDPDKAYVDSYLMENLGIYPVDGIYEYETPLYAASGAWWLKTSGAEVPDDFYLVRDGDTYTVKPTPAEDFDFSNKTNVNTPLLTIAMWTDPVDYGTVERYFPASVGGCDFRLVIKPETTGIDSIASSAAAVCAGHGTISVTGDSSVAVTVSDLNGRVIYSGVPATVNAAAGLYIVKAGSTVAKVIVR